MGTRTPNYDLYIPGQGEEAWDDEVGGNFTTIDAALQALADIVEGAVYQINNVTYVAANARWNGSTWNRVNTGAPAVRLMLNSTTGTLEIATAAAGANPITWTTVQAFSATGLDMKSKKIANLATPTAESDAATKAYIDGLIAALIANAQFTNAKFVNKPIFPFTVVPSENVLYTSTISKAFRLLNAQVEIGSIRIGPAMPNSMTLKLIASMQTPSGSYGRVYVYKNGTHVASTNSPSSEYGGTLTLTCDIPSVSGGDLLTFKGTSRYTNTFSNFRLCGDVITGIIDTPTFADE